MSTTAVNFVLVKKGTAGLNGSAIVATPYVDAFENRAALAVTGRNPGGAASNGVLTTSGISNNGNYLCDLIQSDLSKQGFAKNGAIHITTSGTNAVNVDLTNLATGATSQAGDTTFATVYEITVYNVGNADMTLAPGGANPANFPKFSGTTPTLTIPAGSAHVFQVAAGATVDGTHKILTITPTSGGDVVVCVGGA